MMDLAPLAMRLHSVVAVDAKRHGWPPPMTIEVALSVTRALGRAVLNRMPSIDDLVKVGEEVIAPAVAAGMPAEADALSMLILAIDQEARMFGHTSVHGARAFREGQLFVNHLVDDLALGTAEERKTLHAALTAIAQVVAPILH
jgi:hypothetical protein